MHSNEAVRVALIILSGINPNCGEKGCLAKGRLATQENIDSLENLGPDLPTNQIHKGLYCLIYQKYNPFIKNINYIYLFNEC